MTAPPPISLHHPLLSKPSVFFALRKQSLISNPSAGNSAEISHTPTMSNNTRVNGTTITHACAACKYQRRKCAPNCVLAPYFPHDRQRQFLNAHKLFGVSNITKIIKSLDSPSKKDEAIRAIVFQSDIRAADPVGGCYRIICELHRQIEYSVVELQLVLQQLSLFRAPVLSQQPQIPLPNRAFDSSASNCHDVNKHDQSDLGTYDPTCCDPLTQQREEQEEEEEYLLHEPALQDVVSWAMQDPASSSLHEKQSSGNECNDLRPMGVDIGGERFELKFDYEQEEEEEEETNEQESDEAISTDNRVIVKDEIAAFIKNGGLAN